MEIINFGSLNMDHVYQVDHIVENGMTIEAVRCDHFCGGKGLNQSVAIARAGARVSHIGAVGMDGKPLIDLLKSCKVGVGNIRFTDFATGHAIIQVDRAGNNSIIVYGGANRQIDVHMIEEALEQYPEGTFVVLQNEISNVPYIIRKAHERGMVLFYNPSPAPTKISEIPFELIDYLFINENEGMILCGEGKRENILGCLRKKYPDCSIVLTLGKDGVKYAGPDGEYEHDIFPVPVIDTTGAGDTFCGYFISVLSKGGTVPSALRIASRASSICVSRRGAASSIPTMDEVFG